MKKILFCLAFLISFPLISFSQTLNDVLRAKIDKIIAKDEKNWWISTFKHNVTINDVTESGETLIIYGTYDYYNTVDGTVSIKYTATAKVVLQEIVVKEVCWKYNGTKTCAN